MIVKSRRHKSGDTLPLTFEENVPMPKRAEEEQVDLRPGFIPGMRRRRARTDTVVMDF